MATELTGKNILITGASSGIGAACAEKISEKGAKIFVGDINQTAGEELVEALIQKGAEAKFAHLDVSDPQSVASFHNLALEFLGNIDVAINNAGIDHDPVPMLNVADEVFHRNIAVNLAGIWYCMKHQLASMLTSGGGHILNVASVAGLKGSPTLSAYSAAKHGVVGLSKTAAIEYARANIRVNVICPSFIRTPMVESVMEKLGEKNAQKLVKANPMKRLGEPEEIAATIAWLCSDESSFITGHSVVLDGGLTA